MATMEKNTLEGKVAAELHEIASDLGIEGHKGLKKADLIDRILTHANGAAKTPAPAIVKIHGAVTAALTTGAAQEAIAKQGMTLSLRSPAEIAAWLPGEVAKWAAVIKAAGVVAQ